MKDDADRDSPVRAKIGSTADNRVFLTLGYTKGRLRALRQVGEDWIALPPGFHYRGQPIHALYLYCEDNQEQLAERQKAMFGSDEPAEDSPRILTR